MQSLFISSTANFSNHRCHGHRFILLFKISGSVIV
uniref:Uncharacterized protein n=1 Tax=Anguilla anguilla TaxID=7936 RepID=A0A0E9QWC1_ANGAN